MRSAGLLAWALSLGALGSASCFSTSRSAFVSAPMRASRPAALRSTRSRAAIRAVATTTEGSTDASSSSTPPTLTQKILERIQPESVAGGAGGSTGGPSTWEALQRADATWETLKNGKAFTSTPPVFVREHAGLAPEVTDEALAGFDVVVCGGTLGVFIAAALARNHGVKVAVIERAPKLAGRAQEWNISLQELKDLVEMGVFEEEDIDGAVAIPEGETIVRSPDTTTLIATHFRAVRAGYNSGETEADPDVRARGGAFGERINAGGDGKQELWVDDVLNLGIRPDVAIQRARARLEESGGVVFEGTGVSGIDVYSNGAVLDTDKGAVHSRLVIDCMGHASPAVRQARAGQRPDGICVVVGTCAKGYGAESPQSETLRPQARLNDQGDLIYTNQGMTDDEGISAPQQYFWEAFPAGAGEDVRTTYLFTYIDANEGRPSLTRAFEDYWTMLKAYQGIDADGPGFDPVRALFAFFPTYRNSPLPSSWDRVLHCGDASGIQSPLSFGGFGALTRHLGRLSTAVGEALTDEEAGDELLTKRALSSINPYMPNLSATWMFQRSMSARVDETKPSKDFVNRLLRSNFDIMNDLGTPVMRPFLQDVVQFTALAKTLGVATIRDPLFIPQIIGHVGVPAIAEWVLHFSAMGLYTALYNTIGEKILDGEDEWVNSLPAKDQWSWKRKAEAWKFGSGLDYELPSHLR